MNRLTLVRIISVLVGAAVLFGPQQGLDMKIYFAVPVATVAYLGVKLALGLALGADGRV